MVTCNAIGRLGNQCFELATAISYSLKHGLDFSAPLNSHPHFIHLINPAFNPNTETIIIPEDSFVYTPVPFKEEWRNKNIVIQGYRQSALYFNEHREELIRLFNVPYKCNKGVISVHIRRTDYLTLPNFHPTVTLEYIHKGIDYFASKGYRNFYIFSDDINWCCNNIERPRGCSFCFSRGKTDVEDLGLASSCEAILASNSSYSWWAYYLNQNKNKIGIFPRSWFGKNVVHNTKDLYMPEMILL